MTKAYSRFITALFCLFLGGMLVLSLALPDRERSETENRVLAQWPEFSWVSLKDGSFTSAVEEYFADQFPFRDSWTGLKGKSEHLIGKTDFNDTYLCGDALIAKVPAPEEGMPEKNLGYVAALAASGTADVHLGLIPSAAMIHKDRLPAGAESWDQEAFLALAEEQDVPMVDFAGVLAQHAQEPIFYRTDHHWTSLGAYYGYTAVMEALGRGDEVLPQSAFTPELASDQFNGTLYSQSGVHWLAPDEMTYWVEERDELTVTSWRTGKPEPAPLYDRSYLTQKDKYSSFLGGNQPLCVIKNSAVTDGSKLLLIRDSYSDSLAPFLAQHFAEVHLIDLRQYHAPVSAYAAENDIGDILAVYSIPNFITDRNLLFISK